MIRRLATFALALGALVACQTKQDVRREAEMTRLRKEVQRVRGDKVDIEVTVEEMKADLGRLANLLEERAQYQTVQFEAIQKEMETLSRRLEALEQRPIPEPPRGDSGGTPASAGPVTFDSAKKLFDAGKYDEAVEAFRTVVKKTPKGKDRKARFWLGESLFLAKDYTGAVLEFGEFKKRYPTDELAGKATYRQANAFRSLKKSKEAKLFYQELVDKYPSSVYTPKAKAEMKNLK